MKRTDPAVAFAVLAASMGLPTAPSARTWHYSPNDPRGITRAERERRKAKRKAAKESRKRNRR